jgi:hypothetical protein
MQFIVVNLRTVNNIDRSKVTLKAVDGKSWPMGKNT